MCVGGGGKLTRMAENTNVRLPVRDEASKAILRPTLGLKGGTLALKGGTPALKGGTLDSSASSVKGDLNFCIRGTPHQGGGGWWGDQ